MVDDDLLDGHDPDAVIQHVEYTIEILQDFLTWFKQQNKDR